MFSLHLRHIVCLHPTADIGTIHASKARIVKDKVGFIPDIILRLIVQSMIDLPVSNNVQDYIDLTSTSMNLQPHGQVFYHIWCLCYGQDVSKDPYLTSIN